MTDQPEREGWTHELWERSRYEAAARWQRHGGKHDPTLARVTIKGDAVTLCFRDKVRFHDERQYRLLRLKAG